MANLLIAGRCISVSHLALGSVRVESTLAALGQVVGTAAWYCLQKGIMPRQLYAEHIADFQQILLRDDLWDQETVRDELLRLSLGYFHWLKNSYSRRSLLRSYAITALGKYNARRESRRIIGDYVLTQNDCEAPARFSDAVSYLSSFVMDLEVVIIKSKV